MPALTTLPPNANLGSSDWNLSSSGLICVSGSETLVHFKKIQCSVLTSVLSLVLTPVLSFFSSDSLLVSLVVFCLCWIAVDGSCVNSCSGGIRWTPWGHCRREVEWRTMHQMDHGYRKESWRISTANDWASYEKREFIQSVFFTRVSFLSHVRIFCWGLVFIF